MNCILVTGSSRLIGRGLRRTLEVRGHEICGLDLRSAHVERGDVRDSPRVTAALAGLVSGLAQLVEEFRRGTENARPQAGAL